MNIGKLKFLRDDSGRFRTKKISIILIRTVITVRLLYALFTHVSDYILTSEKSEQPLLADVWVAQTKTVDDKTTTTGEIKAYHSIELRSEISGKITQISVEEGQEVKKGQLLVKINDEELQAKLRRTQYSLNVALETQARQKQLFERGATSQEEYDRTLLNLNNITSEIDIIEAQISKTEIRAPFDGIVGLTHVSPGAYITPSTRIASLQNIEKVKLDFHIPERYRMRVTTGQNITFSVQGVDSLFHGVVYAIEPQIDATTRSMMIRALSPNPKGLLTPGSFANIELIFRRYNDAIMLPSIALLKEAQGTAVFALSNGQTSKRTVHTGVRTSEAIQITSGINVGDTILINGIMTAVEGREVGIRNIITSSNYE